MLHQDYVVPDETDLDVLDEIVEAAGWEATNAIVSQYGGCTIYIPARLSKDHWLVELVGITAAEAICKHFQVHKTGIRLLIPKGSKSRSRWVRDMVCKLHLEGNSVQTMAQKLRVHERTIYRYLAMPAKRKR